MNALRLNEGVPTSHYLSRTGQSIETLTPKLDAALRKGLIEPWDQQLRPTERGRLFLNDLLEMFL